MNVGAKSSVSFFTILLYHPASAVVKALPEEFLRRILMGLAMGLTAVGIIYSPWGKQSGAHMNPAFTLGCLLLSLSARIPGTRLCHHGKDISSAQR